MSDLMPPTIEQPPDDKRDFRALVKRQVYQVLANAGELCRLRCQDDPDLLDSIADGIYEFLCDGDVFDQVFHALLQKDLAYTSDALNSFDDDNLKVIVDKILG